MAGMAGMAGGYHGGAGLVVEPCGTRSAPQSPDRPMTPPAFTPDLARALPGPTWLADRRSAAAERFGAAPLPTPKDEVWRYSRIDRLDLEAFGPVTAPAQPAPSLVGAAVALADRFGARAGLVVTVDGSVAAGPPIEASGLTVARPAGGASDDAAGRVLGSVASEPADFGLLNDAFAPDPVVITFDPGAPPADPVVVVHVVGAAGAGSAAFPRTVVRAGEGAHGAVIALTVGADTLTGGSAGGEGHPHLVVPVVELDVAAGARLAYVAVEQPDAGAWHLASQVGRVGADGLLQSFTVALGGSYARQRTDATLSGEGARSELRAAYLGRGDQMLDFRTLQDHVAPRTTSDLLFTGAVREQAHSVYSGMIRIRQGAVKSDAAQTNHNLVLDDGAHADSVPNLDIEENDVRCSHGSTVGPVDEEQRYYLETRGVPSDEAERLIVRGFFADIATQVPVPAAESVVRDLLASRLAAPAPGGSRG